MKRCNKCGKEKQLEEFHRDRSKKDGRKTICKECRKIQTNIRKSFTANHKKLDRNITKSINLSIRLDRDGSWTRLLGFDLNDLKDHLENRFEKNMHWDNYGSYWIIDKIIPTSMYHYGNIKANEFKKAWSLKNLRPVEKREVVKKKDKIIFDLIKKYSLFDILPVGLIQFYGGEENEF